MNFLNNTIIKNNKTIHYFKQKILQTVNSICPQKYKSKYNFSYYLDCIILVLKDITSWKSLGNILNSFKINTISKYHFKTIYNVFLKWSSLCIFENTYNELLLDKLTYNCHSTIDLFIDSTSINNKNGVEDIAYGMNKKKKISKISFICDKQKHALSVSIHKGNINDVKTLDISIDKLIPLKYRKINMICDKGYISKDKKQELKIKKINLIYPKRQNQKIKTTKYEKKKLKNRYIIEHLNQRIKNYERIALRKDKLNHTFLSNIYLALLLISF